MKIIQCLNLFFISLITIGTTYMPYIDDMISEVVVLVAHTLAIDAQNIQSAIEKACTDDQLNLNQFNALQQPSEIQRTNIVYIMNMVRAVHNYTRLIKRIQDYKNSGNMDSMIEYMRKIKSAYLAEYETCAANFAPQSSAHTQYTTELTRITELIKVCDLNDSRTVEAIQSAVSALPEQYLLQAYSRICYINNIFEDAQKLRKHNIFNNF